MALKVLPPCWFSAWPGAPRSSSPGIKAAAESVYRVHVGKEGGSQLEEGEQ